MTPAGPTIPEQAPPATSSQPTTLAVGDILGERYLIEERISEGAFGEVFRASDREIRSHQVALKWLRRPAASEAERADALRELMLIASVSHPSVVQFKDYGWHAGRLWFAMPWYDGRPLDKLLGAGERVVALSRAEAKPIFVRIAQGLSAMHAVGIHHHDIKPENIFLAEIAGFPDGLPILLDLGISTRRGENPKGLTVAYASPESAAAMLGNYQGSIGAASDVYSLALALRNVLDPTLLERDGGEDLARLHQRATTAVAYSSKRELRYLAPYFERWLSLDPDRRPSAGQFAEELAVLTLPEEKRAARLRLLKRAGPLVVLAGLLIALLVAQLEKQKSALDAQRHELQDERGTAEQLRNQSAAQLAEIEAQGKSLGSKNKQLEQAIALGRKLHAQLTTAAKRNDQLDRQNDKLTVARDGLSQANAQLMGERDALAAAKAMLSGERDGLAQEKRTLSAERDALAQDKRALTAERDVLTQEKAALGAARDALLEERRVLTAERDQLSQDRRVLSEENERLKRQLEELRNAAPAPAPPAPPEAPPAP